MKREFLENLDLGEGVKLPKEAIEAIMAEYGKSKGALENTIATLTTERDGYQSQLSKANEAIKTFEGMDIEGIKTKAGEWESKYKTETEALQKQLDDTKRDFAYKSATAGLKFTSEGAKKAFLADLQAKNLALEDGKVLGLDDFTKAYRENDPGAFASEEAEKVPYVVTGTSGVQVDTSPFQFNFTGVRAKSDGK